jgi:hypothetical protein
MEKQLRSLEYMEWKNQEKHRHYLALAQPASMSFDLMASRISLATEENPPAHMQLEHPRTKAVSINIPSPEKSPAHMQRELPRSNVAQSMKMPSLSMCDDANENSKTGSSVKSSKSTYELSR